MTRRADEFHDAVLMAALFAVLALMLIPWMLVDGAVRRIRGDAKRSWPNALVKERAP